MSEQPPIDPASSRFSVAEVRRFGTQFSQFVEAMNRLADAGTVNPVVEEIAAHLGTSPVDLEPLRMTLPYWRWSDLDRVLDRFPYQPTRGIVGSHGEGLADILQDIHGIYRLGPVERTAFSVGPGLTRFVGTNALRFIVFGEHPAVVFVHADESVGMPQLHVEVLTADANVSSTLLTELESLLVRHAMLRGKIVSFRPMTETFEAQPELVHHERPEVPAEDVILPAGRLERIRAAVLGLSENAAHLREAGQHLSRGVLLYGPPGTGKTHTVRHLLSQADGRTVFILQGQSLGLIRQAAETARQLQPAIIVLEDADLVAADRDFSEGERPLLLEVLDVMDGLDDDADIAFVLTTNRVDVLEEALALRPGRIDLAVSIPLPSAELRTRLFSRSCRALPITQAGCRAAAEAAAGTTGSFPKEAVRRAVLDALAEGRAVDDAGLLVAVRTLRAEGQELRAAMAEDAAEDDDAWSEESDEDAEWGADAEWGTGAKDEGDAEFFGDGDDGGGADDGEADFLGDDQGGVSTVIARRLRAGAADPDLGDAGEAEPGSDGSMTELQDDDEDWPVDDLDDGLSGEDLLDMDLDMDDD